MEKFDLQKLKDKDLDTFKLLVEEFQYKVINTCYRFVRDFNDAEDVAQDVFIEIFKSISNFREESKLSTWIYRIAVSKSLDFIRTKTRKKRIGIFIKFLKLESAISVADVINNPEKNLEDLERKKILHQAIEKLPESQRIALMLSQFDGFEYKEVASIMNISLSAVESLIYRAKVNLKKKLFKYYQKQN